MSRENQGLVALGKKVGFAEERMAGITKYKLSSNSSTSLLTISEEDFEEIWGDLNCGKFKKIYTYITLH